ncbi:glycosyltransferase family 2 protein [Nocardioides cavernaquae]|uniref:Glycosyltransferase n=1 Tax=Nocardioides cavernaquae TaxID=2321396 RepID=A0A3A5H3W1_9ACTN|nr:glycosyltransferase [Nocardioides cavernaquae]RJS45429.1 glycosyltransferase [Nocardioides cavernaquae]
MKTPARKVPIALIAFNRPQHTARTLEAIRAAAPDQLFVVLDGARPDRPDDAPKCAEVRALVDAIDWTTVSVRASDENRGCEGNVETGLDWVFTQVAEAIVLEDDCVPDPTFFGYAEELLDRYRTDTRVWQIAGNSHGVPSTLFGEDSYRFSSWASVWGWATWADRWQRHREVFPRTHIGKSGIVPIRTTSYAARPGALVTRSARKHFEEASTSGDVITHGWDKQWWITMISEGGLAVSPAVNLVENVGFGADATHGVVEREMDPAHAMTFPLQHPTTVAVDTEVERELELLLNRVGGRAARVARRLVRSPRARRVLRRMADSKTAVRAARAASRLRDRGTSPQSGNQSGDQPGNENG